MPNTHVKVKVKVIFFQRYCRDTQTPIINKHTANDCITCTTKRSVNILLGAVAQRNPIQGQQKPPDIFTVITHVKGVTSTA